MKRISNATSKTIDDQCAEYSERVLNLIRENASKMELSYDNVASHLRISYEMAKRILSGGSCRVTAALLLRTLSWVSFNKPLYNPKVSVITDAYGEEVKAWRKSLGYSKEEVAEMLGVSKTMLKNLEEGIFKPSIKTMLAVREVTGINFEVFFVEKLIEMSDDSELSWEMLNVAGHLRKF